MTTTTMTPATGIAVSLHNTTRWHFIHWIDPVARAVAIGLERPLIIAVGEKLGPSGLRAAVECAEVPA